MIDRNHEQPVSRQARLLGIGRGSVYFQPRLTSVAGLALMRRVDEFDLSPGISSRIW